MVLVLVTHKVKDFTAWKKVFDSAIDFRKTSGEVSALVYRDESDPNTLTVVNKWDSMANAHKFVNSPDLKAAMEKAGVVGVPDIHFLNET